MTSSNNTPPTGEFILFQSDNGQVRVECRFESETLWLSQELIAQLYGVTPQAITQHIKTIYDENELDFAATCKDYLQVQTEGKRQVNRQVSHYSLPIILAIGYRYAHHAADNLDAGQPKHYRNTWSRDLSWTMSA